MAHSGTKLGTEALARRSPTSLPEGTDRRTIRVGVCNSFCLPLVDICWISVSIDKTKPGDRNNPIDRQVTRRYSQLGPNLL